VELTKTLVGQFGAGGVPGVGIVHRTERANRTDATIAGTAGGATRLALAMERQHDSVLWEIERARSAYGVRRIVRRGAYGAA
jgi:hypothetical protein